MAQAPVSLRGFAVPFTFADTLDLPRDLLPPHKLRGEAMLTTDQYKQAERDVILEESQRGWRLHAVIYLLVNAGLIALNLAVIDVTETNVVWFPFPLVCWGIGLTFHYLHGVRWAERELRGRQDVIEEHAETTRKAA